MLERALIALSWLNLAVLVGALAYNVVGAWLR
jgi:hypothetical protein